jgi:hypothetical protein
MANGGINQEALYFNLIKALHTSGQCPAFSTDNHNLFVDFLGPLLKQLSWDLTPAMFSDEQLCKAPKGFKGST